MAGGIFPMEAPAAGAGGNPSHAPGPGAPGVAGASLLASNYGANPTPKSTPEQRARWREKSKRAYERRKLRAQGGGEPVGPLPAASDSAAPPSGGPDPGGAPGVSTPAPVPWDNATLRPLFEQLIPALEKADVASLVKKSARLGNPKVVPVIEQEARWPAASKATLLASGPQCAAEALNELGIGADKAHWAAVVLAAGAIVAGRVMLNAKLDKMIAGKESQEAANAEPTPPPAA